MIHLLDCHGKGVPEGIQYIGRVGKTGNPPRSPLSNPYSVEKHGMAALQLYRIYMVRGLVLADPAVVKEISRLQHLAEQGDVTLGCWCATRPAHIEATAMPIPEARCHGDIVASVITHLGIRIATYARARMEGDDGGPGRWAAWVARGYGPHPHAVLAAMCFGFAEARMMGEREPLIAAGMALRGQQ